MLWWLDLLFFFPIYLSYKEIHFFKLTLEIYYWFFIQGHHSLSLTLCFSCIFLIFWFLFAPKVCTSEESCRFARVSELFVYEKFSRVPAATVEAGDICAVCGIDDIQVRVHQFCMVLRLFSFCHFFYSDKCKVLKASL